MKPYIYLLIFLPILIGCNSNRDVESLLDHIDSLVDTSPDSALSQLKKIDGKTLPRGSEIQARYAFMYSKAEYKCYIDAPNDSLISIAVDYYDKYGTDEQKFSSHLYHGCILSMLSDYDSSSEAFFKAISYSDDIDDYFNLGHLYNNLSYLMRIKHCDDEAENFARLSYQCYMNIGKEDYAISALISLANAKIHKNQLDSCKIYAEDILLRARQLKDTASIIEALRLKEHYAVVNDSIELALSTIRNLNDYAAYTRTSGELAMLSYIFSHKNEIDSVRNYIRLSLSEARTSRDSSFCYAFAAKAFTRMGDYRCAIAYKDSMFHFANTLLRESLKHTSIAAQRDYVASQLSISNIKNRNQKLMFGCFCAILCCIGIILFLLFKRNVAINELQAERIKNLQNELLKVTDEQRSGFYQIQNNELLKILHQKATNGRIVTNDEWGGLDSLFYTLYPIYGERLRSLYPLSSTEWRVCMLIKVGFIPSEIAELMNKSLTSISSIRSRLFEKIFQRKGKPAELDKFLMSL